MKKQLMTIFFLFALVITSIAQTEEPLKLNGNSGEELEASMKKIVATLDKEEKDEFTDAYVFVVMGKMMKDASEKEILEYLDGKTAKELIDAVKKAQSESKKETKECEGDKNEKAEEG